LDLEKELSCSVGDMEQSKEGAAEERLTVGDRSAPTSSTGL